MTTELDHARAVLAFADENRLVGASILADDLRRLIAHIERLEADAARSRETGERILADSNVIAAAAKAAWVAHNGGDDWARSVVDDVFSPADDWPEEALDMERVARAVLEVAAPTLTTEDEREALEDLIMNARDEYPRDPCDIPSAELADAILASPVWRGRGLGPITDEMADAAQDAHHEFAFGPDEPPLTAREKGITRQAWRVALEAAAKAQR